MCGRFNIIDDPLTKLTSQLLGLDFSTKSNSNVCPSEHVACVGLLDNSVIQINPTWGIQPAWANRLIINAQAETVSTKKTFKSAFRTNRCIIPFSGWYEWQNLDNGKKQKYLFTNDSNVMFMAGILFEVKDDSDLFGNDNQTQAAHQLVTLTTAANEQCHPIHARMPLLVPTDHLQSWLTGDFSALGTLLHIESQNFDIAAV